MPTRSPYCPVPKWRLSLSALSPASPLADLLILWTERDDEQPVSGQARTPSIVCCCQSRVPSWNNFTFEIDLC